MRAPVTHEQLEDAERLKLRWKDWKRRMADSGEPASQEALSELLGFNQSAVSQYLNGRIALNVDAAVKFASIFGCPVRDFSPSLAEQAGRYGTAAETAAVPFSGNASRVNVDGPRRTMVPIKAVELRLQAGIPGFDIEQGFEDGGSIDMPLHEIENRDLVPQCLLAVKVKGESMEPMLFEGDSVVINIADTKWVDQGVFAINYDGKAVIKRLSFEERDWWMVSENKAHKRERCRLGHCIVVGRVVYRSPSWRL